MKVRVEPQWSFFIHLKQFLDPKVPHLIGLYPKPTMVKVQPITVFKA
jgi:hypothetical protein